MPRVRISAGRLRGCGVPGAGCAGGEATRGRPAEADVQRRDELDAVQRQDVADALRLHFGISVDWRTTPLDRLLDIRLRAAKAADLQARLGVSVDWQRYSWVELEALRRTLLSFESGRSATSRCRRRAPTRWFSPSSSPMPARPEPRGGAPLRSGRDHPADVRRRAPSRGVASGDPDAVIRPTFAARPAAASPEPSIPTG